MASDTPQNDIAVSTVDTEMKRMNLYDRNPGRKMSQTKTLGTRRISKNSLGSNSSSGVHFEDEEEEEDSRRSSSVGSIQLNIPRRSRALSVHRTSIFIRQDKPRCKRRPLQVAMLIVSLFLVLGQITVFNYYFVLYGEEHPEKFFSHSTQHVNCSLIDEKQQHHHKYEFLYCFALPDLVAIVAMAWLPICAGRQLYQERVKLQVQCGKLDQSLRYAGISYGLYAISLVSKVSVSSKSFLMVLQFIEGCHVHRTLGINMFILILGFTSFVFFTIVFAHHAHNSIVEEWLKRLVEKVTFDLLDGVHFLQILFTHEAVEYMFLHPILEYSIISLSCINFMLPTVSLLKMRQKIVSVDVDVDPAVSSLLAMAAMNKDNAPRPATNGSASNVRKNSLHPLHRHDSMCEGASSGESVVSFIEEDGYNILQLTLINLPYLVIRCYLWSLMSVEVSVFILKNIIEIVIQTTKIAQGIRKLSLRLSTSRISLP